MQDTGAREQVQRRRVALLCVLLSLLLHAVGAWLLLQFPKPQDRPRPKKATSTRVLTVKRAPKKKEPKAAAAQEESATKLPFAKTDADRPQQRPDKADFQGKRDSRAEGQADAPPHKSDAPLPTMSGEVAEEINTVERERQDGPIEHEGEHKPTPPPSPVPEPTAGMPETPPTPQPDKGQHAATTPPAEATPTALPLPPTQEGDLKLQPAEEEQPQPLPPQQAAPAPGLPTATGKASVPPRPQLRRPLYDPSLADHAQPGFRTTERRTRSMGQFVLGRNPSLRVASTPTGRYEELLYRLIARSWYAACDEHRGDIIPGRLIIAIRIHKQGYVDSMSLVTRRGAGLIQQSFTFGAIRRAQLPPMPAAVQNELKGDLLELIFTFHFD